MASILRNLKDDEIEQLHKMLRRDAKDDLSIAAWIEERLGKEISGTEAGKRMIVSRYRSSRYFREWIQMKERQEQEVTVAIEETKARYEAISKLIQSDDFEGFEDVSRAIQARLLILAQDLSDEDLRQAASGRGWIKNILTITQASIHDRYRRQAEKLKEELTRMIERGTGKGPDPEAVVAKVDDIMGLNKPRNA